MTAGTYFKSSKKKSIWGNVSTFGFTSQTTIAKTTKLLPTFRERRGGELLTGSNLLNTFATDISNIKIQQILRHDGQSVTAAA